MPALRPCLIGLLFFAIPALATGQVARDWRIDTVRSKVLGQTREIYVAAPPTIGTDSARYPVLLVLDADDQSQFAAAVANVRFLASRIAIPDLLIVGIPNGSDRTHDLTPPARGSTAKQQPTAGGADQFLQFLTDEIIPVARLRYRALPMTVLMGHSFGGLFGLYVAAHHSGTFAGTIAASPALWWNDSSVVNEYAQSIARSSAIQRIFVAHGSYEAEIGRTTTRFASAFDTLHSRTVVTTHVVYAGDTHGLTPQPTLIDGIRFVFAPVSLANLPTAKLGPGVDSATVVSAVLSTEKQYADGARSLGLPDRLPRDVLNRLGYNVLFGLKKPRLAAWVFEQNAMLYPEDAFVYDSWGDALVAARDTSAARTQFEKAIALATRTHDPILEETQAKLAKLLGRIPR